MNHPNSSMLIKSEQDRILSPIQASFLVTIYQWENQSFATNSFLNFHHSHLLLLNSQNPKALLLDSKLVLLNLRTKQY